MLPAPILSEHLVQRRLLPVRLFQDSQQSVEMNLLHQSLFPLSRVRNPLADGAVLHWPVEPSIFFVVVVLAQIDELELVLEALDFDRLGRLRSFQVGLINGLVQVLGVLAVVDHARLLVQLVGPTSISIMILRLICSFLILIFIKIFNLRPILSIKLLAGRVIKPLGLSRVTLWRDLRLPGASLLVVDVLVVGC